MVDLPDGVALAFSAVAYADIFPQIGFLTLAQGLVDANKQPIPAVTHITDSGFRAVVYADREHSTIVIAYRGTALDGSDAISDLEADAKLAVGGRPDQFVQGLDLFTIFVNGDNPFQIAPNIVEFGPGIASNDLTISRNGNSNSDDVVPGHRGRRRYGRAKERVGRHLWRHRRQRHPRRPRRFRLRSAGLPCDWSISSGTDVPRQLQFGDRQ